MNIAEINLETRKLVDATSASYSDADLLRRVNTAYEEITGKLIALDRTWSFGDSNFTALPTGTQNLVDNQKEYAFDSTSLTVESVQILDADSKWRDLNPINIHDITPVEEYQKTKGIPFEYGKRENFMVLFPAPDSSKVTLSNGLKVIFQRTADLFTSAEVTAGTKVPGFASPFHILIALKAALPYAVSYKKDRVKYLISEIARVESDMLDFYSKRERDVDNVISMSGVSSR